MKIPNTILEHLGGNKFRVMTGAKDFSGKENPDGTGYLQFRLGMIRKMMRITLNAADLYDITLYNSKGAPLQTVSDIFCDMLPTAFEKMTGLRTKL